MENDGFKVCPFCKEKIRKEAVKCRFCGEWLEQTSAISPDSQNTNEASILPLPEPAGSPPPDKIENKAASPKKILKGLSQKTLFWISVSLLTVCFLLWVLGFASGHWSQLSPAKQGAAIANIMVGMIKILVVAGLVSWGIKDKTEKLFAVSVVIAVSTVIAAYYFQVGRQEAQQKAQESDRILASNINSLQTYIQQGAVGDVPEFKPTGDADMDAGLNLFRDFYQHYVPAYRKANMDIQALNEIDVFDESLWTNKLDIESDIQKRIEAETIIETFATNAVSMFEDARNRCASINTSEGFKQGLLESLDQLAPQYKAMYASWIKLQKSQQDFLQFLDDTFADYQIKDGKILFGNSTNLQKYDELVKNVFDTSSEAQQFQKRAIDALGAAKAKLQ